jgi:hypothetical protein
MTTPIPSRPFGVEPSEMTALAQSWQRSGHVLATVDVDDLENTAGIARCMSAVRSAAGPTRRVVRGVATRLDALSQIARRFGASARADDDAAAAALRGLADR